MRTESVDAPGWQGVEEGKLGVFDRYIASITRPGEDPCFKGSTGRVQSLLESGVIIAKSGFEPAPENTHVFLCGNPGMIQAAQEWFLARGFRPDEHEKPGNIHTEKYWT